MHSDNHLEKILKLCEIGGMGPIKKGLGLLFKSSLILLGIWALNTKGYRNHKH